MDDFSVTESLAEADPGVWGDRSVVRRVLAILVAVVFAEAAILVKQIVFGLVLHAAILLVLFGIVVAESDPHRIYEALVFVPLLRLLNLGTGIVAFDPFLWLGGVYVLLLGSMLLVMRGNDVGRQEVGLFVLRSWHHWAIFLGSIGLGITLGAVQWLLDLEELFVPLTPSNVALLVLVMGLLVGFVEELLFRGLLQQWLADLVPTWVAIVAVSVVFGFMHSIWFNPGDVVFAFVVSLLLGWVYARSRNFWSIWAIHGGINVMVFAVLPVLVDSPSYLPFEVPWLV